MSNSRRMRRWKKKPKHHTIHREGRRLILECDGKVVDTKVLELETFILEGQKWIAEAVARHKEECEGKK